MELDRDQVALTASSGRVLTSMQVLPVSEEIGRIIMNNGNAIEIADQAKKEGIRDLRESALLKVMQGVTGLEEINRVTTD